MKLFENWGCPSFKAITDPLLDPLQSTAEDANTDSLGIYNMVVFVEWFCSTGLASPCRCLPSRQEAARRSHAVSLYTNSHPITSPVTEVCWLILGGDAHVETWCTQNNLKVNALKTVETNKEPSAPAPNCAAKEVYPAKDDDDAPSSPFSRPSSLSRTQLPLPRTRAENAIGPNTSSL